MFRSEAFDAHLHIAYLFKMKDNQGVQDYLTNELYRMREKDFDFYLPELCLMALSRPKAEKLHAFLLDKAASRMYYAVKIHWIFQAAVEDRPAVQGDLLENAMKLYQESEMAVVNSRVYSTRVIELRSRAEPPGSPAASPATNSETKADEMLAAIRSLSRHVTVKATEAGLLDSSIDMYEGLGDSVPSSTMHWRGGALAAADVMSPRNRKVNDLDLFMLKQLRCDNFNLLNCFASELTKVSAQLVACAHQTERKRTLACAMAQVNHWLLDRRLAMAVSGGEVYMTGLSLPLPWPTSEFTHVIKIHLEDCKVFRTRQRAPYLITLEVVDFSDVIQLAQDGGMSMGEALSGLVTRELGDEVNDRLEVEQHDFSGKNFASPDTLFELLNEVDPLAIRKLVYPDSLAVVSSVTPPELARRSSIVTNVTPPTGEVIVVDDSAVSVVPSRKVQRRATLELRKKVWGDLNEDRIETIRSTSVYGHLPSWRLQKVIVKGGDDVRQEVLAGQLVSLFRAIFQNARLPLWLRPYAVVATSANSGLVEMIPNTVSIDALKKEFGGLLLNEIFFQVFADHIEEARLNFIESCAAYSVVSYLLQVKDRHNGNLLLDSDGHLIHIDYGFMLSNAPGGTFALETSPFKLTQEFIDVMGGEFSSHFETFRTLVIRAFLEARKYRDQICQLARIVGECNPKLACFSGLGVDGAVNAMSDRFCVTLTEEACIERIVGLIDESVNNWRTSSYDRYQLISNGIM
jgi:phosphatidylinositol 4-kinase